MENNDSFSNRLKSDLGSKGWWYGAVGGILTTMIGILLTIGVGAYVQKQQDKRLARNMMFNVVNAIESNCNAIEEYDSLFSMHGRAIDTLITMYNEHNKDLSDIREDTLYKYLNIIGQYHICNRMEPENLLANSQTFHQFGNADMYQDFEAVVQMDRTAFDTTDKLIIQWKSMYSSLYNGFMVNEKPSVIIKTNIENHLLTDYLYNIKMSMLPSFVKLYKKFPKMLLKVMHATQKEYDEYLDENDTDVHGSVSVKEKI